MRRILAAACIAAAAACSKTPAGDPERVTRASGMNTRAPATATIPAPAPLQTWFDATTAQRIMTARAEFDAAELTALEESERTMGSYRNVMMITREQYVRQLAGAQVPVPRSDAWHDEHERRAAYARSVLAPKRNAARERLERETLSALSDFFRSELRGGRISRSDYDRYTLEIRRGHFPAFRSRKWSGPPVYEFRGATVSPEYQKILQEVRRLWQAQGWNASAVMSVETDGHFYETLVPRAR